MKSINANAKLKVGGRNANKGGSDRLAQVTANWVKNSIPSSVDKDLGKISMSYDNVQEYSRGTTGTGLDYVAFTTTLEKTTDIPMLFFVYWDGKKYRGYEPIKGNMVNTVNHAAFGEDFLLPTVNLKRDLKYAEKFLGYNARTCGDLYEYIKSNYELDFDMCLEDFESRVEVFDEHAGKQYVMKSDEFLNMNDTIYYRLAMKDWFSYGGGKELVLVLSTEYDFLEDSSESTEKYCKFLDSLEKSLNVEISEEMECHYTVKGIGEKELKNLFKSIPFLKKGGWSMSDDN